MTKTYYQVDGKRKNLLDENWDYLIILDACRYDYFKDIYGNYLDGEVKKAISPAFHTLDWLNKVVAGFYDDIVYISANPYINSKIEIGNCEFRFDAKKHFFEIIDVWKLGWNYQFETVHPHEINKALFKARPMYKNKRYILHYIQPHEPYISQNYIPYFSEVCVEKIAETNKSIGDEKSKKRTIKVRDSIGTIINKTLGVERRWKIGKLFNLAPKSQPDAIGYSEGIAGLMNAYKENLEVVLECVAELTKNVSGTILITADHGEYLGEDEKYGHGLDRRGSPTTEVPWLLIENNKAFSKKVSEKEIIKKRINMMKTKE